MQYTAAVYVLAAYTRLAAPNDLQRHICFISKVEKNWPQCAIGRWRPKLITQKQPLWKRG